MSFLLVDVEPTQWILLGLILVLLILYPVFMYFKNKKEKEKFEQLSTNLKIGDKVITSSGVYGEIVSIKEENQGKLVTLKTGDDAHSGYVTIDVLAIYTVINPTLPEAEVKPAEVKPVEEVKEQKTDKPKTEVKKSKPKTKK